jgi:hypothetical protein
LTAKALTERAPLVAHCVRGEVVGDDATLVPWWSVTKSAIAACVLLLVAERKLDLDRKMNGHVFTLRQVLQHTPAGSPATPSTRTMMRRTLRPAILGRMRNCCGSPRRLRPSFCRGRDGHTPTLDISWCAA